MTQKVLRKLKKKIEADKIAEAENQKRWDDEREKEKIERKKQEELTNKMKYSSNYTHDNSHKNGLGMTDTEKEVFGNNPPW